MLDEPLIFERGSRGRVGWMPPAGIDGAAEPLPAELRRDDDLAGFPEVSELETLRHFLRLSQWNYSAATTLYPLGSCTMKYNPVVNEVLARCRAWRRSIRSSPTHSRRAHSSSSKPRERRSPPSVVSTRSACNPPPARTASCSACCSCARTTSIAAEPTARLIPSSAHGTNPASATLCGYEVREVPMNARGLLSAASVAAAMDDSVAALMVTNPNTLGLFEEEIEGITAAVHAHGGLVYMDGANLNAIMGVAKPGDMGVDVMQFNLHKTFSTPHGGGGPGAGPVAVRRTLAEYLPVPRLVRDGDVRRWSEDAPKSVGRMRAFYGNFGILLRAYAYLARLGGPGLHEATRLAVLNANYLRARLRATYHLPYETPSLHECVFSDRNLQDYDVHTLDVAKRLLDYGFYAPTIYFPLVVKGALMIEPTETETKETLDEFADAMLRIADEARDDPTCVREAPHRTRLGRLDETRAARRPVLRWRPATRENGGESA
jgi:glycine dehydrogenase subunit 2